MNLITAHPFVALILVPFIAALIALFVGGLLASKARRMPEQSDIEPRDFEETVCAWCQKEKAILAQPHESHGICERHYQQMLAEAKRFTRAA